MLRESLQKHLIGMNKEFRFRGQEPGRLENFSDACFALAITLLLISTSPPTSYAQISKFAWEVIPFSLCIVLILLIWNQHFIFYFRYGLRNATVVVLNTIFLIIVLFYVYPLKFLAKAILLPLTHLFGQDEFHAELVAMYGGGGMGNLMIIYGVGAMCVFLILAALYRYALKKSDELELNSIELFDTKASMQANFLMAAIPFLSVAVAVIFQGSQWAGFWAGITYFLYSPAMTIFWKIKSRRRAALLTPFSEPSSLLQYPEEVNP
jgi:uncharacterized membrane protein